MTDTRSEARTTGVRSRRRSRQPVRRVRSVRFGLTEEEHSEVGEAAAQAGLVRRIGVNLNQAVAKLNSTGQRSGDLLPYAVESVRRAERLDAAAEAVRRRLR
jgi:hypothetical protein